MSLRVPIRTIILCLALGALTGTARAGDGWWGKLDEGEAVSLKDIVTKPSDFRHRTLTFFCIYHGRNSRQYFDPMRTPFNAKRHVNFSVWPDGTPLWEERAFKYDVPFLYIGRTHPQRDALLSLPMITRIEITGKIRAVLRGSPCIEVFSFRETGHRLTKRIVEDVVRGDNYARAGTREGDELAARRYRNALTPDLPPVYGMMVRKRLAGALRRLGHLEDADRVESGEILGGGSIPEPSRDDPDMPSSFDPGLPSPATGELPPEPISDMTPPGAPPLSPDLPGAPVDAPALPPPEGGFPPPAGPGVAADDLPAIPAGAVPGVPYTPSTSDADLPGERTGGGGTAAPAAPPLRAGARAPGPPRRGAERRAPTSRALRGIPPKRRPRLSGVK